MTPLSNTEIKEIINTEFKDERMRNMLIDRMIYGMRFDDIYVKYYSSVLNPRTYSQYKHDIHIGVKKLFDAIANAGGE